MATTGRITEMGEPGGWCPEDIGSGGRERRICKIG